jgi:membrane protein implicated in regulation of membrane protease activity
VTAALPQIIAAGVLYLILGVAAFIISLRPPGTPFTLAGILMMRSKLVTLGLSWGNVEGAEEKYDSTEPTSEAMRHQLSPSRIREIDESESDGQ